MFNTETENIIKQIPHIEGVDIKNLPQFLSRTYARIISLRTKYPEDSFQFSNEELQKDIEELSLICNTLELLLVSGIEIENRKSVAFVSALGRKFISMTESADEQLSIDFIPSRLYAGLLFLISGNFPDADEITNKLLDNQSGITNQLIKTIHFLCAGKLVKIKNLAIKLPSATPTLQYVESLLWLELIKGVKALSYSLLTGADFDLKNFEKVKSLSVQQIAFVGVEQKEVFSAPFLLSSLLIEASKTLLEHSLFQAACPIGIDSNMWVKTIKKMVIHRPYLWSNHLHAIQSGTLNVGISSIITFPTGSGKTTLSELKIATNLLLGKRVLYLVPTHALEHQVAKDLNRLWNNVVSDVIDKDGEYSVFDEEDGFILVMTPEKCLTILELDSERLSDIGLVIFDEFHLINGANKRSFDAMTVILELLDRFPEVDYLFLSAMVSNGRQIADWISQVTQRDCLLLDNLWKPTCQLQGCIVYDADTINRLKANIQNERGTSKMKNPSSKLKKDTNILPKCLFSLKAIWDTRKINDYYHVDILDHNVQLGINKYWQLTPNGNEVATQLALKFSSLGLKTIVFVQTPQYSISTCQKVNSFINKDYRTQCFAQYQSTLDRITIELGDLKYSFLNICQTATIHHSYLIEEERYISEQYFRDPKGVSIMFATPTVSQGINLPADIVLIVGTKRYDSDNGFIEIDAHDILNAAGRAGRAGFRSQGAAILIPSNVLSMKGHSIDDIWMDIKDEIFSKGDHCLEIIDPYENILEADENMMKLCLLKTRTNKDDIRRKLNKTFYASKLKNEGKQDVLTEKIEQYVNKINFDDRELSWIDSIACKNGYPKEIIHSLVDYVQSLNYEIFADASINSLSKMFLDWIVNNVSYFSYIFETNNCINIIKSILNKKKELQLSSDDIITLLGLINAYIGGANYEELEKQMPKQPTPFLFDARRLVLKVIPNLSYICGIFVQVIMECLKIQNREDLINDEIKAFASCVREGVSSSSMLRYKVKSKYMRVEAHRNFRS